MKLSGTSTACGVEVQNDENWQGINIILVTGCGPEFKRQNAHEKAKYTVPMCVLAQYVTSWPVLTLMKAGCMF